MKKMRKAQLHRVRIQYWKESNKNASNHNHAQIHRAKLA
ncbi:hypothetical protein ViNHUV68_31190 [Vibrio sp. NH-UV-68]